MKKILFTITTFLSCSLLLFGQGDKLKMDKDAIKSMAGCYQVTFEFAETFSPDTSYKYYPRKFDKGIEYVFVVEETDTKIALQHLLIVNDSMIIKHWRQDWLYENTELLVYTGGNEWKKNKITTEQAKGTWTQKVFQVDDGPRYDSYGTWMHVDGRHFWQGTGDAPLPRREFTKRSDYQIVRRHSHIEITSYGWILDQDNEKIIRENNTDKLLCWEKGHEKFSTGNYNCKPAIDYWTKNEKFWSDVRAVWVEVYAKYDKLKFVKRIEGYALYERLFEKEQEVLKSGKYDSKKNQTEIRKIIEEYITK